MDALFSYKEYVIDNKMFLYFSLHTFSEDSQSYIRCKFCKIDIETVEHVNIECENVRSLCKNTEDLVRLIYDCHFKYQPLNFFLDTIVKIK